MQSRAGINVGGDVRNSPIIIGNNNKVQHEIHTQSPSKIPTASVFTVAIAMITLISTTAMISTALLWPKNSSSFITTAVDLKPASESPRPLAVVGRVFDEQRNPISGARVSLPNPGSTTSTDELGRFRLDIIDLTGAIKNGTHLRVESPSPESTDMLSYEAVEKYITLPSAVDIVLRARSRPGRGAWKKQRQ